MSVQSWILILGSLLLLGLLGKLLTIRWHKKRRLRELKIRLDAQEREKERIAKDLHDYFGARLSTLKLYMQTINKFDAERIATMTSVAMQMVDSTIIELRHLLFDLNPKKLYKGGLQDALTELVNNIKSILKFDIDTNFQFDNSILEYSIEVSVYRIIQELINNTLKHAKANKITINLLQDKKELILNYTDNGIGFEMDEVTKGYGLRNIKQHTLALEACMKMKTAAQAGCECKITIPLK